MRRLPGWRHALACAAAALLAACASPHGARAPTDRALAAYALEARFGLKENGSSYSGRLFWKHAPSGDEVLVQDPFGGGVAELVAGPARATMRTADGQVAEAAESAELMRRLTGIALPVRELARWLTARGEVADGGAAPERDAAGRVVRQVRQGWRIEYRYDDEARDALPSRVVAADGGGIELRLAIDAWTAGAR